MYLSLIPMLGKKLRSTYHIMRIVVFSKGKMEATLQPIPIGPVRVFTFITLVAEPFWWRFRHSQDTFRNILEARFHYPRVKIWDMYELYSFG